MKGFITLLLGGACLTLSACAQQPGHYAPISELQQAPQETLKPEYRIGAGDGLEIKFFLTPELGERVTVRPDGKISLMFAPNILAEGLTAEELAADIRASYAPHVKQIDLVVLVRSFASQKAFVGGEVGAPGAVLLSGNETVLQVLSSVGWVTPAAGDTVVLVRRDPVLQGERAFRINFGELRRGINMAQNIVIHPKDVLLVPPSDITSVDRWVDQNIRQVLPVPVSTGAYYNIGSSD